MEVSYNMYNSSPRFDELLYLSKTASTPLNYFPVDWDGLSVSWMRNMNSLDELQPIISGEISAGRGGGPKDFGDFLREQGKIIKSSALYLVHFIVE